MGVSWSDKAEADLESINPIVKDQLRRNAEVTLPNIMPCRARSTSAMARSCGIAASPMNRNARQSGSGGKTTTGLRFGTTSFSTGGGAPQNSRSSASAAPGHGKVVK